MIGADAQTGLASLDYSCPWVVLSPSAGTTTLATNKVVSTALCTWRLVGG
jgi:hypothetical protein